MRTKGKNKKFMTHLWADLEGGIGHAESAYKSTSTGEKAVGTAAPGAADGSSCVVEHESVTARRGSQAGLVAVSLR